MYHDLEHSEKDHGSCDVPVSLVLLHHHAVVDEHPANETKSKFTKYLPVKDPQSWIQFTSHEPVVNKVACVSTDCKLSSGGKELGIEINS